MPSSIRSLIGDKRLVALRFRQALEPVEGWDVAIHPPTYRAPKEGPRGARRPPPRYTTNKDRDGIRACELDTVQSQSNRMEASFEGELADVIPRHAVEAGSHRVDLAALPHRIADASIRATGLEAQIRQCFEAFAAGDAAPLARLSPLSLVYGVWDSRDTRVSVRRAIASRIEAHDITVRTRSAQYSAVFDREALGLTEAQWKQAAEAGFAPVPTTGWPGGVLVRGGIVHTASIMLNVLRGYGSEDGRDGVAGYLLALALGGLVTGGRRYQLRSGCDLVPLGSPTWEAVYEDGERRSVEMEREALLEELRALARGWSEGARVELGGEPRVHQYDPQRGREMVTRTNGRKRVEESGDDADAAV